MATFEEKIINKVPGNPFPNPKEKQGYIEDLSFKTKVELIELLERQDKLLSNKSFLNKLPDKGEKIKGFRERVAKELAVTDQIEKTCGLLSSLSLSKTNVIDEIEWTGKLTEALNDNSHGNSSDEETDPLKIIASHAGSGAYKKKKHRKLKEQEKLERDINESSTSALHCIAEEDLNKPDFEASITPSSVQELVGNPEENSCDDLHAKYLCDKVDKQQEKNKKPFKPHCTTKSGVHPGLFVPKHQGPHWEVTAATPPPPVHGAAKLLSLQDSLLLQQLQAAQLKDVQAKHASERLATNVSMKLGSMLPDLSTRNEYRDAQQAYDSSNCSDEDENEGQSDEDDKRDTIVYTYTE